MQNAIKLTLTYFHKLSYFKYAAVIELLYVSGVIRVTKLYFNEANDTLPVFLTSSFNVCAKRQTKVL
jgi:hypothetical protein